MSTLIDKPGKEAEPEPSFLPLHVGICIPILTIVMIGVRIDNIWLFGTIGVFALLDKSCTSALPLVV